MQTVHSTGLHMVSVAPRESVVSIKLCIWFCRMLILLLRKPSMAKRWFQGLEPLAMAACLPRLDRLWWYLALVSAMAVLGQELARSSAMAAPPEFEGFGDEAEDADEELGIPIETLPPPPTLTRSGFESDPGPPDEFPKPSDSAEPRSSKSSAPFDYWDEDEFEGLPELHDFPQAQENLQNSGNRAESRGSGNERRNPNPPQSYYIEVFCVCFLVAFAFNFFVGRRENERIALAWAAQFATKGGIFEKNFSLLGTGDGTDTPLLLKEGQNVFKFYASGRRHCQGLLATMELQSRHDLISRMYNFVVSCKDEVRIEVYMNEDSMDQVVFALARKKVAKGMHKEMKDLQLYANPLSPPPSNRRWISEELVAISESREVAFDMITDTVLDQVFGEKAFEKHGKGFVSLHFTDQYSSSLHKKMLVFKFSLPSASNMADMTRLVAIVPYYIDLIGRYKLSAQVRGKAESARAKVVQEAYKELQNSRQEAIQRKKEERKKALEEAEAKLSAEAIRKKEEKERLRQLKKSMPKMKMARGH